MTTPTNAGRTTLTEQQAKAACSRFMSQWGPEDDETNEELEGPWSMPEEWNDD